MRQQYAKPAATSLLDVLLLLLLAGVRGAGAAVLP
jgi:hypothetical protein